jgi:hypothetical protein
MHVCVGPIEQELLHGCHDLPLPIRPLRQCPISYLNTARAIRAAVFPSQASALSAYLRSASIHRVATPIRLHLSSPRATNEHQVGF